MNIKILIVSLWCLCITLASAQVKDALQLDFTFRANADIVNIQLDNITRVQSHANFYRCAAGMQPYGHFAVYIKSLDGNVIYYKHEMNTLVEEYQATDDAQKHWREFSIPVTVQQTEDIFLIEIYTVTFDKEILKYEEVVNLKKRHIKTAPKTPYKVVRLNGKHDVWHSLDIAVVAEGYTAQQMDDFLMDTRRVFNELFQYPPFSYYKDYINLWVVKSPSLESGTTIPQENIIRHTIWRTQFNMLNSDRYLGLNNLSPLKKALATVQYDHIVILVNTPKYGGSGFYNHYCCVSAKHEKSAELLIHELGHSFAALGDEYFNEKATSMKHFTDTNREPLAPNLTTLKSFNHKWEKYVLHTTPIPTPDVSAYDNTVGIFEGGGYEPMGVYRAERTCMMRTLNTPYFCIACQNAIESKLEYYIETTDGFIE